MLHHAPMPIHSGPLFAPHAAFPPVVSPSLPSVKIWEQGILVALMFIATDIEGIDICNEGCCGTGSENRS